jgi:hypothetical protein
MGRFGRRVGAFALTVVLTATLAWAQATAQIGGSVTDESGAVLPGVTVTMTQTDTGFVRTVVTDAGGAYLIPNLPTGPYRLEVALHAFRTYVQTGIVLPVALVALAAGHSLEAFNLLKHFNWGLPQANFAAATFGRITSQATPPRIMQFGVKYGF